MFMQGPGSTFLRGGQYLANTQDLPRSGWHSPLMSKSIDPAQPHLMTEWHQIYPLDLSVRLDCMYQVLGSTILPLKHTAYGLD